jgi:hypothetical protein
VLHALHAMLAACHACASAAASAAVTPRPTRATWRESLKKSSRQNSEMQPSSVLLKPSRGVLPVPRCAQMSLGAQGALATNVCFTPHFYI